MAVTEGRSSGSLRDTSIMVLGSVVAAGGAYLFIQGGARVLGAEAFGPLSTLWTIQFLVLAVALIPIEQLIIRRAAAGNHTIPRAGLALAAVAVAVAVAYAAVARQELFGGDVTFVLLTGVAITTLGIFAVGRGELASTERYRAYGVVTAGHSLLRLVAGMALLLMTRTAAAGGLALAAAPLLILAWAPRRPLEAGRRRAADIQFLAPLTGGNAAAQTLLLSGPLVLARFGASATAVSVLFVTLALFRAPVAVANNVLSRLLPPVSRLAERRELAPLRRGIWQLAAIALVAGTLAGVVGALWGPQICVWLFGSDFRPTSAVAAWAAAGSTVAAVAAFAGQILVGLARTGWLAVAWLCGLGVAGGIVALATGTEPMLRVAAAFGIGEATAMAGIVAFGYRVTSSGASDVRAPG